jgi:vitamin B12 transporter
MTTTLFLFLLLDVRGVVSDRSGRPVQGAQVVCGSETKSTDSTGSVEFSNTCDATVTKPGFAPAKVSLTSSSQITLALAPASERVVVTATGAPIALEDAGVAATVFTASDFQAPHVPFVQDLLRDVPGLYVAQNGQNGAITSLFSRGGNSYATLVLLDGVPLTDPGGQLDLSHITSAGIDRMEVIRGPGSALFGAEGSSAVIQMFTHHGDSEDTRPHGSFVYDRGNFSTDHWSAMLDGGLSHRLDYAFTGDQYRSTGEFPNDAYRITSGTVNLGYRFSESTSVRATYREFDSYTGDPGSTADKSIDYLSHSYDRDSAVSVRLDDVRSRRFSQRLIYGYHRYRDQYNDGFDPNFINLADRNLVDYQGTLTHRGGAVVFGYEFQHQSGLVSGVTPVRYNNGFFVQEQYAVTPRIFLSGGARVEHSSAFGTQFAPRGAVTFRLPREVFFRLSASRGVQEPSLLQNFANEAYYVGNPNLKPEKTNNYEAALSREFFSRRARAEITYFRNSFRDLIVYDFSVNPSTWHNIQRSWARGVELSGTVRLASFATVRGGYTKLYTRITQSNDPTQIGTPLIRRPRNAGTISLDLAPRHWTFSMGARMVGLRPDSDFLNPGVKSTPAYNYVFMSGSWQATKHVEPFARIGNLLDERYQEVLGYLALSRTGTVGVRLSW